ncbi:N-acetylglutamate synthase [hydrothermal vent metagenome]|uniref:amino-acid N-acetyltransferase n=1 Tax=hydrothermal vent metagenome TaxID=652676 RepID=A0A3B0Y2S5_9ZZZZ
MNSAPQEAALTVCWHTRPIDVNLDPMPKKQNQKQPQQAFVDNIRQAAPYIQLHCGSTVVLTFGGEAVDENFEALVNDIALLNTLGIRLVLVHGARPQIEQHLKQSAAEIRYANGLRITDDQALVAVKNAVGSLRVDIEAKLSMGLVNAPMATTGIGVASGNFVTARPLGIRDGVDYGHTGEVRRIDATGIQQQLEAGRIVLLSSLGYSPTGEIFNLSAEEVATATAVALRADKLILLLEGEGLRDSRRRLVHQLSLLQAEQMLRSQRKLSDGWVRHLNNAIDSCRRGVKRTHLVSRTADGGLLLELFTRDGIGTLISAQIYEGLRTATIDDVGGIMKLIAPLEEKGVLVKRSRELLEMEIDHFQVVKRDGMIIACAALYPYSGGLAELACVAVHPDYRGRHHGDHLLSAIEQRSRNMDIRQLFVLTTQTAHWFRERGFKNSDLSRLPLKKRGLYNYQRNSKAYVKVIE